MTETTEPARADQSIAAVLRILDQRGIPLPQQQAPAAEELTPEDPGHPEFHRRARREAALAKLEVVPPRYRGAVADQPEVVAWAKAAADDPGGAGSLMLWGPTGTGKTHQAYGAVRIIAEAGPVEWGFFATSYPELMADLRPGSGSDETRDRVMRQVMRSPLVLLDDLGAARGTEWVEETLYRIVNHRYNHLLPTVFTSNSAPGELPTLLGDRIASRLVEMTRGSRVQVAGGDRRMVSR